MPNSIDRLLKVQAAISVILTLALLLYSFEIAWSFGVGAVINLVSQFVFALIAFQHRGARSATLIAQAFARGESTKLMLIAGLLAAALSQIESIVPLATLLGLMAVQSVFWFFPFIDRWGASSAKRD